MDDDRPRIPAARSAGALSRRRVVSRASVLLAAIAVGVVGGPAARAAEAKKAKGKAAKEDFFYQEEPGEKGKRCENCVNFEPTVADKGTCALVEGEVCKNCYCQGWTDKKAGKKAGA
jgi:hypothetical protein